MKRTILATVSAAAIMMSGAAFAQTMATASTDLNIRSGPGPQYEVIGLIGVDQQASILGCLDASQWCQVSFDGVEGWAYSDYLIAEYDGAEVVVTQRPAQVDVPVVQYEATASGGGALAGGATGAVAGALIGGPIGAAVGAVAGAATGGMLEGSLAPEARTYVLANPMEPVYLDGEVVVGAQVPETVEIREIPDYQYRYVYVNQQPVIIEPESRRIVYVVR